MCRTTSGFIWIHRSHLRCGATQAFLAGNGLPEIGPNIAIGQRLIAPSAGPPERPIVISNVPRGGSFHVEVEVPSGHMATSASDAEPHHATQQSRWLLDHPWDLFSNHLQRGFDGNGVGKGVAHW